ncbi:MAG TPA: hypothetical protein VGZ47_09630 [Gemmataceae bacterium]|jgi:hypothetical protein|nr:hypothetical protein [Gemmataceae bacterium]
MRYPCALISFLAVSWIALAEPPAVNEFKLKKSGNTTYFHVQFGMPAGFVAEPPPRLVPQDENTRTVVPARWEMSFAGQWAGEATNTSLRLFYSVRNAEGITSKEEVVTLRRADADQVGYDLRRDWAKAQMAEFAVLQKQAPECSFYPLARVLLARKYDLPEPHDLSTGQPTAEAAHRQIFETHTGGAAVAESLQLHRLLQRQKAPNEARTISVNSVPGINIPQHPWDRMRHGAMRAPEPLASFVPADNYYVRFRDLSQLLVFGDLLQLWGGNLLHALEFQTHDSDLRNRYEKQLCLPSARLATMLKADSVREIGITGSDPYLVDGTDITVILHVNRPEEFLAAHDALIADAKFDYGRNWQEKRSEHRGIVIREFAAPWREVSLFRAEVEGYVICSNSRRALQRTIDARWKAIPTLVDSPDFNYMRTVFRSDEPEDGFGFLSDAFIRRLMSPAEKIKQKRRAESLGRLALLHNAALFVGWETGRLPANMDELLAATGLKADDFLDPNGEQMTWDGPNSPALSPTFHTLAFATPLLERSIDEITPTEKREYEAFRNDYQRLWNQFFDPVGLRFRNGPKQVQLEAYILPLVQSEHYRLLRQIASGSPLRISSDLTPSGTLMQLIVRIDNLFFGDAAFVLRLEDDPAYAKRMKLVLENGAHSVRQDELDAAFWNLPLTIGIVWPEGRGDQNIDGLRQILRDNFTAGEPERTNHRDVTILSYAVEADKARQILGWMRDAAHSTSGGDESTLALLLSFIPEKNMPVKIHQAMIGNGYYISLQKESLVRLIDQYAERQKAKAEGKEVAYEANTALFVAPSASNSAAAIRQYLEWQTHRRALAGNAAWLPLYKAGAIPKDASTNVQRERAKRWLGFIPVSPDGATYRFDARLGEVVNERHGWPRAPALRTTIAPDSPLAQLLERFRTLRTDLKFREDGIHTTVTLERAK